MSELQGKLYQYTAKKIVYALPCAGNTHFMSNKAYNISSFLPHLCPGDIFV